MLLLIVICCSGISASDDYLRVLLRFEKRRLGVCFRLNSLSPSPCIYFDYLPKHPVEELYLALENCEMFNDEVELNQLYRLKLIDWHI